MSVIRGDQIRTSRMRPSIHINRPEALGTADVEDDHALDVPKLDDLESIRRFQSAAGRRRACSVRGVNRGRYWLAGIRTVLSPRAGSECLQSCGGWGAGCSS